MEPIEGIDYERLLDSNIGNYPTHEMTIIE